MPATVTREFMAKQMEDNLLPFWWVKDTSGGIICDNQDEDNVEKSMEMLNETLDAVMDPTVVVTISSKTRKQLGNGGNVKTNYREYKIILRSSGVAGMGNTNLTQQLMEQNNQLLNKITDLRIENIQKDFQQQIKELKDDRKNDPFEGMAIEALSGLFGIKKPVAGVSIAGSGDETINEDAVARQKKIRAALIRLSKIDPKLDETLTLFATWAEKNPEKYPLLIMQIK